MKMYLAIAAILVAIIGFGWMRLAPDSIEVRITGVTGDGNSQGQDGGSGSPYRINTVTHDGKTLVFRNDDARFWPPYFKPDSADVQAEAERVKQNCPDQFVKFDYYDVRFSWLSLFPNVTDIEGPPECFR